MLKTGGVRDGVWLREEGNVVRDGSGRGGAECRRLKGDAGRLSCKSVDDMEWLRGEPSS